MKILIAFLMFAVVGCGGGGGGGSSAAAPSNPGTPAPTLNWFEVSAACQVIIPGYLWARYDSNIDRIYVFELTGGCISDNSANPKLTGAGACGTRSSYIYGAYILCYSAETVGLMNANNRWLTVEEL